jgi:anhydro-N-acetylmuramic acid kinase
MTTENYNVIGVMSGTSLDGVDLAYIAFAKSSNWTFDIIEAVTVPYPILWKQRLQQAINLSENELQKLNEEYTVYLADVLSEFVDKINEIPSRKLSGFEGIDLVSSHGHTILHQPEDGITLQIGNLPELAQKLQKTVVCDFRVQDVKFGGQGAPLVPIGDRLLFSQYEYCLNLGGFANISFEENQKRLAFDVCPVNIVLNHLTEKLGFPFDEGGKIAQSGKVSSELLGKLNGLSFYKLSHPKSLGLEWVQQEVFPLLENSGLKVEDQISTFTEHVAVQLASVFKLESSVFVTGGGAYNSFLLERIKNHKNLNLILPEKRIIEFKEALIFGLLGVLKMRGENNCLASVTGAKRNHSSGKVYSM